MARAAGAFDLPALRGIADHRRVRADAGAVHVHRAGGVPAAVHLHDVPLDRAAADPARDRPDLRHRRRRDRPVLSRRSSPFPASSSRCCSRNTISAGSRSSRRSPPAFSSASINGVLIARIGIPSFMATLGTQFFWAGMATVLSGGKSYALRGAEESSVWQWIVGRPFGDQLDGVAGSSSRFRRSGRRSSSSSSGSSSPATASASTCCSSAIPTTFPASSASTSTREDQALHADGRARRVRGDDADAGEQEFLRQPGPGLSADRDRRRADRGHLDLRRPRHHRRHRVRLLHHRDDRGRAWWRPASPAPGCAPSRA